MKRPKICECDFCLRYHRVNKIKKEGDVAALRALVDELHNALFEAEDDLNYRMAILDGSWPQAEEILMRSLELARKRRIQQETMQEAI